MYQIGVTGGIGSGKTLVCSILEVLGIPVYYADIEARKLMNSDPALKEGITGLFGDDAFLEGKLDRKFVGSKVFGHPEMLKSLNNLVHPAVRKDYKRWVSGRKGVPYVVEEAAILFESGAQQFLDMSVLVYAPRELRVGRVIARDGVEREEVLRRMSHQMDEKEKRDLADEVIINDNSRMLVPQVVALHEKIVNRK
jgi:dephospho-CoA kinase